MVYLKYILYALILYLLFVKLVPSIIADILNLSKEVLNESKGVSSVSRHNPNK
jgi:hypothetical protein